MSDIVFSPSSPTFGLALPTPYKTVEPFHVAFADMAYGLRQPELRVHG